MNRPVSVSEDLSDASIACTYCGREMSSHQVAGSRVRYFRCPTCRRWVSSTYSDVLRADAHFQARPAASADRREAQFDAIKDRLERWLSQVDEQDPYQVLGVSPADPLQRVKSRYRELAMRSHPDRGGSADEMRRLNLAFERVLIHHRSTHRDLPPAPPDAARLPVRAR